MTLILFKFIKPVKKNSAETSFPPPPSSSRSNSASCLAEVILIRILFWNFPVNPLIKTIVIVQNGSLHNLKPIGNIYCIFFSILLKL